jgi:hypothetical protein
MADKPVYQCMSNVAAEAGFKLPDIAKDAPDASMSVTSKRDFDTSSSTSRTQSAGGEYKGADGNKHTFGTGIHIRDSTSVFDSSTSMAQTSSTPSGDTKFRIESSDSNTQAGVMKADGSVESVNIPGKRNAGEILETHKKLIECMPNS